MGSNKRNGIQEFGKEDDLEVLNEMLIIMNINIMAPGI